MTTFVWDARKAEENYRKHGISFHEATTAFLDPLGFVNEEFVVGGEVRKNLLARSSSQVVVLVVHRFWSSEDEETIRIISAREATPKERKEYVRRARQA